jgi:hypothetical protein
MSRLGQAEPLTLETARLVCACAQSGSAVTLSGLTAIDTPDAVEIAKILATAKGQLRFPQLKRISPKTLTALIEKTDVLIPPIESLELIPEPDGGPTEDFVTPEGFEERQKQLELQIQCPDRSR